MAVARNLEAVKELLKRDGEVTLPGLGKLKIINKAERMGRNPATGAPVKISARKAVKFSIATKLAAELNPV
jgi:DNA-binding protein HU-beta